MSDEPDRPRPRPGPGSRTAARRARTDRAATITAVAIVAVGVLVAAVLIVLDAAATSGGSTAGSTPGGASIAAPPSFGASLPISTPAAATSGPSDRSAGAASAGAAGDAEFADPGAVSTLLAAAGDAVQTVDSYDYHRLDRDQAAGDAVSTGAFRGRYDSALRSLRTSARKARTVQQAVVQKIAVTSLSGDTAGVLAFGRLDITDAADPEGTSRVLASGVTLHRVGTAWRISDMTDLADQGTFAATPPGNAALLAAVTAGAREVVDLLSYARVSFDADFNRALAGLTGPLRTQQEQRRAGLEQAMDQSQTDYAGEVRSVGVESASGSSVLLLVCATGYSVQARSSTQPRSGTERFEVGVQYVGGRWLVSEYLALPAAG